MQILARLEAKNGDPGVIIHIRDLPDWYLRKRPRAWSMSGAGLRWSSSPMTKQDAWHHGGYESKDIPALRRNGTTVYLWISDEDLEPESNEYGECAP